MSASLMTASSAPHSVGSDRAGRPARARAVRTTACAGALLALGACASGPHPLHGAFRDDALKHRTLHVKVAPPPAFYADTASRRLFGLIGVFSMRSAGQDIVDDYGLVDPARNVAQSLQDRLTTRHALSREAAAPDLELNVDTLNWDFRPYRGDARRMYVVYAAQARLVDLKSGRTLASGRCRIARNPGQGESVTVDDLLAHSARVLQDELRQAGTDCVRNLEGKGFEVVLRSVPDALLAGSPARTAP